MVTGTRMGTRSLERGSFLVGGEEKGTAKGLAGRAAGFGSSKGATSMPSWGMPFCGPCSRHLKSQVSLRSSSRGSSRLERVTQESLSPLGHRSRMGKFLGMENPMLFDNTCGKEERGLLVVGRATKDKRREGYG